MNGEHVLFYFTVLMIVLFCVIKQFNVNPNENKRNLYVSYLVVYVFFEKGVHLKVTQTNDQNCMY